MLFFVLAGLGLHLPSLATAGVIGVVYFFVRILGKYAGAFAGAKICGYAPRIQKCLGLALIPQAGVSIGLAALGQRMLPEEAGLLLSTIILSSGLLYEIVGPACAKASLFLSHTVVRPAAVPTPSGRGRGRRRSRPRPGKPGKRRLRPRKPPRPNPGKRPPWPPSEAAPVFHRHPAETRACQGGNGPRTDKKSKKARLSLYQKASSDTAVRPGAVGAGRGGLFPQEQRRASQSSQFCNSI